MYCVYLYCDTQTPHRYPDFVCTDTPDVMQDMLKPGKDLSNAMTVGFLATQQRSLWPGIRYVLHIVAQCSTSS